MCVCRKEFYDFKRDFKHEIQTNKKAYLTSSSTHTHGRRTDDRMEMTIFYRYFLSMYLFMRLFLIHVTSVEFWDQTNSIFSPPKIFNWHTKRHHIDKHVIDFFVVFCSNKQNKTNADLYLQFRRLFICCCLFFSFIWLWKLKKKKRDWWTLFCIFFFILTFRCLFNRIYWYFPPHARYIDDIGSQINKSNLCRYRWWKTKSRHLFLFFKGMKIIILILFFVFFWWLNWINFENF